MRNRSSHSKFLVAGIAAWYCAAALAQTSGTRGAHRAPTPSSQANPAPATSTMPSPASLPNPTPASHATPTPMMPPPIQPQNTQPIQPQTQPIQPQNTQPIQQQNNQTQFPSTQQNTGMNNGMSTGVGGQQQQAQVSRCAALTGIERSECERRDTTNTENLPAGMTPGQRDRQLQRDVEAARDAASRSNSADTMRAPPVSEPQTSTTLPEAAAPAPNSTPRENSDTLDRPRE